jgi:hypothetical protein
MLNNSVEVLRPVLRHSKNSAKVQIETSKSEALRQGPIPMSSRSAGNRETDQMVDRHGTSPGRKRLSAAPDSRIRHVVGAGAYGSKFGPGPGPTEKLQI